MYSQSPLSGKCLSSPCRYACNIRSIISGVGYPENENGSVSSGIVKVGQSYTHEQTCTLQCTPTVDVPYTEDSTHATTGITEISIDIYLN